MPLELIRVDERLLHGQVVVGWGGHLDLAWYVVADDDLAESEWEQRILAEGVPDDVVAEFVTVARAAEGMEGMDARDGPGALLLRSTASARRMAESGALEGRRVNLGCLAAREDRREALPYLHLSSDEEEDVRALARHGARVGARDVPTTRPRSLEDVLDALGA